MGFSILRWAYTLSALLAVAAIADDKVAVKVGANLQTLIMHHEQGWGVLGDGVAAHVAGTAPLPMQIKDKSYESGLGTHAPSEMIIVLDGQYQTFEAEAGVQWQGGASGSVVMQAFVDGTKVFDSGILKEATPPVPVNFSVKGADELRLVVTDAGDGIVCDLANWANARIVPDPEAEARISVDGVDMAPFASVRTWDPERMTGTTATRLEPIPAEELFLGASVIPEADGTYIVPSAADGRGCIGIEWLERRRIKQFQLQFEDGSVLPESVEVQYWKMGHLDRPEGGSSWQGRWIPLNGEVTRDGNDWVMRPDWAREGEKHSGTLKVRWILPASDTPTRIKRIRAISLSRFNRADLILSFADTKRGGEGQVEVYNGALAGKEGIVTTWKLDEPLALSVDYAVARPWQLTDRTVLRLTLPGGTFGVAVDDVVDSGPVFVDHAGLLVSTVSQPQDPVAYQKSIAGRKTVLEEVRAMPDQTVEQSMEHVYIPASSMGPTMLSLANDNRKFVLERNGTIRFDNDNQVYNSIAGLPRAYSCEVAVDFGGNTPPAIRRGFQQDWVPIVVIEQELAGISLRQRTFVAPLDAPEAGAPAWLRERALGVSEYTLTNPLANTAPTSFALKISDSIPEDSPVTVRIEGRRAYVEKGGALLALVEAVHEILDLTSEDNGVLRVKGDLPAEGEARLVVYLPSWEGVQAGALPPAEATDKLAQETDAYWRDLLAKGMQIDTPDVLINNLVPASVVHCMMAARNDGHAIAPWIATLLYGPWDSEAHAVIRGMQSMGQTDFARRGLEYFTARYNEEGFLTTGYTVMGTAWNLLTVGENYLFTGDKNWLRSVAPDVERVCHWVMAQREKTKRSDARGVKVPEYGLMPPGVMADWDAFNYYFYMNGAYYAGLQAAGAALAEIGWPGAEDIVANAAAYREDILRSFAWIQERAPVVPLRNGTWTPFYPTHAFSPSPIGNLYAGEDQGRSWIYDIELGAHHLIPLGVLPQKSPEADWMLNHMEDVQFLRPGWGHYEDEEVNKGDWFNLGGFSKCQPYYTRMCEIYALRDEPKPFIRAYLNGLMSLLNREDLSLWEHFVGGSFNKTHETGYFLRQTRLMLAQERGKELWLAPFVTSEWLKNGERVAVTGVPTHFGSVAYAIESHTDQGHIDVEISPPDRERPDTIVIRLRHPDDKLLKDAVVSGGTNVKVDASDATVHFTPDGGPITVRANYAG